MTDIHAGTSRAQFIRNAAKGSIGLAIGGTLLGRVDGVAFAAGSGVSDNSTLQAAYAAESLAVYVYSAILKNFGKFKHPALQNKDYFQAALKNEQDHKTLLGQALGAKTPSGLTFNVPAKFLASGQKVLDLGVTLETAFVSTYLGAVTTLSSQDLKSLAAAIAADEATHFSFFSAAAGGHGVLPSVPTTVTIPQAATTLAPFIPNLVTQLEAVGFPNA